MDILYLTKKNTPVLHTGALPHALKNARFTAALGFFDGVHIGHAACLSATVEKAKKNGTIPAVFTFRKIEKKTRDGLLLSEDVRTSRLFSFGIRVIFMADFQELASLSPEDFVNRILKERLSVVHALCGFNFRFGMGASGDAARLSSLLPTTVCPPVLEGGEPVSATRIRDAVKSGDMPLATRLLGHSYAFSGRVTEGKRLGHTLGFPTANIALPCELVTPPLGVYLTRVALDSGEEFFAITNLGLRPTVENAAHANAESYLFGYSGDLYGKVITLSFLLFMREERRFADVTALKTQIEKDKALAEQWITAYTEK